MREFVLHPTSIAQWHSLVCEAENAAKIYLDEELQSYLVFVLMRFLNQPDIAGKILAPDYIESLLSSGQRKQNQLRDVGDVCLIHAGLFPGRARRKRVSDSYFVELGSGAYHHLSEVVENQLAELYHRLSLSFVSIRDLLNAMCELGDQQKLNSDQISFSQSATGHKSDVPGTSPFSSSAIKH